jgi:hypothetical protein
VCVYVGDLVGEYWGAKPEKEEDGENELGSRKRAKQNETAKGACCSFGSWVCGLKSSTILLIVRPRCFAFLSFFSVRYPWYRKIKRTPG